MKSLCGVGDQRPDSGDKPETIQTVLPKEKTTTSAEVKQLHQGESESSQVQTEGPENINNPQGKPQKVE